MTMMTPQQKIELALRAGKLAKEALELTSVSDGGIARLMFQQVVLEVREIDQFLTKVPK